MNDCQWLCRPDSFSAMSLENFQHQAVEKFGALAGGWTEETAGLLASAAKKIGGPLLTEWRNRVAAEIWFAKAICQPVPSEVLADFGSARPLGEDKPPLQSIAQFPCACAVFPLCTRDSGRSPSLGQVWLAPSAFGKLLASSPSAVDHVESWRPVQDQLVLRIPAQRGQEVAGTSWQLAAALASEALRAGNAKERLALARDWLVTGMVGNQNEVRPVDLAQTNKLQLVTRRRWMFPRLNKSELPEDFVMRFRQRIAAAADVATAWAIITGTGTQTAHPLVWDGRECVIYSFVSKALGPLVALILEARPARVLLWCSDAPEFRQAAEAMRELPHRFPTHAPLEVEIRTISYRQVAEAENSLFEAVEKENTARILFNVTMGNRLTAFAAHTLARQRPEVWLVYRDVDDKEILQFTAFYYEGAFATSRPLKFSGQGCAQAGVDAQRLFDPALGKAANPASFLASLRISNPSASTG